MEGHHGRVGFVTDADSGKVKRIGNFADVTLQPCDSRGRVRAGTEPVAATAMIVRGDDVEAFQVALREKYGVMVPLIDAGDKVRNLVKRQAASERIAVELTLS